MNNKSIYCYHYFTDECQNLTTELTESVLVFFFSDFKPHQNRRSPVCPLYHFAKYKLHLTLLHYSHEHHSEGRQWQLEVKSTLLLPLSTMAPALHSSLSTHDLLSAQECLAQADHCVSRWQLGNYSGGHVVWNYVDKEATWPGQWYNWNLWPRHQTSLSASGISGQSCWSVARRMSGHNILRQNTA